MATATKKCKVCGCEYAYCKTNRKSNVFRYQDVACCAEHGQIYLAQVIASRSTDTAAIADNGAPVSEARTIDEDESDELFEEDFDDSIEETELAK